MASVTRKELWIQRVVEAERVKAVAVPAKASRSSLSKIFQK